MGLDMYLSARCYLSEYCGTDLKPAFDKLVSLELPGLAIPRQYAPNFKSIEISVPIMYWRKASHIHKWFVDNVQDGEDDCGSHYVSTEQLQELADLCTKVCASGSPRVAVELLPCTDGFFFGDTGYDEWYFEQTRDTMVALDALLADINSGVINGRAWDFQYRSSW